ncbi:hypothetical protein [Maricaulis salignorans]|uniref:Uncharacterized protein n=1 Tax=Maricaulis salignorans TaxID=144026 RepID=A0A1G9UUW9_9PROT|nr:hypothetical protein [Maricaulis salignorans]SDM63660.1 hypothetical protein SAMN04488568_11675 [Maricaulis salignorans]
MVERTVLTPALVRDAEAPAEGELWIADLKIRRFGLRVWRTPQGNTSKAYCIRTKDADGKSIRRSFTFRMGYSKWRTERDPFLLRREERTKLPQIEDFLGFARAWAREEIRGIRGETTIADEERAQAEFRARRRDELANSSLERVVALELNGMRRAGLDTAQVDRADSLFYRHVPRALQTEKMCDLNLDAIEQFLNTPALPPASADILRGLLGRSIELANTLGNVTKVWRRQIQNLRIDRPTLEVEREIDSWKSRDVENFLWAISECDAPWAPKYALRLFFELSSCPLSRLLAARWDQIIYYEWKDHRTSRAASVELRWSDQPTAAERISVRAAEWLMKAHALRNQSLISSDFIWPSSRSHSIGHIHSVASVWRRIISATNLPEVTPVKFRAALQRNPFRDLAQVHNPERWWMPEL